jgi:hypothetical protein
MVTPAWASSILASASTNGMSRRCASRRPIDGLARPHHADEHDRTPPERCDQRGFLRGGSMCLVHGHPDRSPAVPAEIFTMFLKADIPRPRAPCQFWWNVVVSGFPPSFTGECRSVSCG